MDGVDDRADSEDDGGDLSEGFVSVEAAEDSKRSTRSKARFARHRA